MDNRLINLTEADLDKPIYRIFSMKRLLELLSKNALILPQVNSWEDVYENFFMKCNFTCNGDEFTGLKEDSENFFGQCWSLIEDSDAMWRIYSNDKQSVRIKTTLRKLVEAVTSLENCGIPMTCGTGVILDTFVGAVGYKTMDELDQWIKKQVVKRADVMPNIKESLFIKRDSFQHESEIRIIYYADGDSDSKLIPNSTPPLISFDITPIDLIEEIAFDPRVDDSFLSTYKDYLIKEFSFLKNKITKSKLYDFQPYNLVIK